MNDRLNTLYCEIDTWQSGNLLGRHPVSIIQMEDRPVACAIFESRLSLQNLVDVSKHELPLHIVSRNRVRLMLF